MSDPKQEEMKPKWRMTDEKGGHQWGFWKRDEFQCCKLCGLIRRTDDKNSPCKGKVKIGLRGESK